MSFMDAMKKVEKAEVQAGVPKVNPLLAKLNAKTSGDAAKKPNPLLKSKLAIPTPKTEEAPTEEKTIQQKAVEEAKEIIKEEVVEQAKEAVVKEAKVEETPVEEAQDSTPKVADVKEVVEEEIVVEEVVQEATEDNVAVSEEPAQEEKPKKGKRGGRKKTAKEPKVSTEASTTDEETVEMFTTRISYEDAIMAIRHPFANEEFETLKEEITEEINAIVISEDMNSITAKAVNAQLAALYQKVWFEHQAAKTFYENLIQKDNGLIDRVKYSCIGEGSNDAQRKKAGIESCMRYLAPGATEPVNLFEVLDFAREQFYFFDSVMRHLSYKKDVMISMNAALKIEDKVLGSGSQM